MDPDVLSYAQPTPADPPPPNPVATAAVWVGGIGWALIVSTVGIGWAVGLLLSGRPATVALGVVGPVGGVLMASGLLLGVTAVAVGPARRRAAVWLGVQSAAAAAVLLALAAT